MRLARGNQAPLEFSSRTTISLSYALLSVCMGASAGASSASARDAAAVSTRAALSTAGAATPYPWAPLGVVSAAAARRISSGKTCSTETLSHRIGASFTRLCGAATTSPRRLERPTTYSRPMTDATARSTSRLDCISSLRHRPCVAPPLKWVVSGTTASPRDARKGVQRARAPSPTQTRPGWPGGARGRSVMAASMSKTLASICSISSPATKLHFCIHSATVEEESGNNP